jgi:hypothetical protein
MLTARKESVPNTDRLNGARADKQLRDMPANDPIYQAQSNALATYHWMKIFQSMPDYLKDQETDQAEKEILINKKADTLIAFLKSETEDLKIVNPDYDKQLQAQVDSIGQLRAWAVKKKLYWALNLFSYFQQARLPLLYAQYMNNKVAANMGMYMKNVLGIFAMLEGNAKNPDGPNFQEAFSDMIRFFQMSALLPQLVDTQANFSAFSDIFRRTLLEFANAAKNSLDPDILKDAADALALAYSDDLRAMFLQHLALAMRISWSASSWGTVLSRLTSDLNRDSKWLNGLKAKGLGFSGSLAILTRVTAVVMLIAPFVMHLGDWSTMSEAQQAGWIASCVGLSITFTVKIATGALRLAAFWSQLGSKWNAVKVFMGFGENIIGKLNPAAFKVSENTLSPYHRYLYLILRLLSTLHPLLCL